MGYLKEATARQMAVEEAAWLAGFLDGEGSITRYVKKGHTYVTLTVYNNVREALDYCAEIAGCGRVTRKAPNAKIPTCEWHWQVHGTRDALSVLVQIQPYLRVKQGVCAEALTLLRSRVAA